MLDKEERKNYDWAHLLQPIGTYKFQGLDTGGTIGVHLEQRIDIDQLEEYLANSFFLIANPQGDNEMVGIKKESIERTYINPMPYIQKRTYKPDNTD